MKQSSIAMRRRRSLISVRKVMDVQYALVYFVGERYANKKVRSVRHFLTA